LFRGTIWKSGIWFSSNHRIAQKLRTSTACLLALVAGGSENAANEPQDRLDLASCIRSF
jgi:hypothetical protein